MISYIRGYYTILIEGIETERFLNYLIKNKVKVYDIKRISNTKIEISIDRKDINSFKKAYRGNTYKISVKKKTGLPFLAVRIYKKKYLWIGAIVCIIILMMTTQFVTDVYIDAPEGIDKEAVQNELYNAGLKPGTYKESIDRKEIREYIMSKFTDIAYVSINVEGTNIFVTITKKTENLESKENSNYCNIIASKNGIIEDVIARSGESLVENGNVVTKGNVLINGANTKSLPEVWANTFYEVKKSKSYQDVLKEKTGKEKKIYTISFYDKEYTLRRNIDYATYIIENKEKQLKIGNYTFPLSIKVSTFCETKETKIELDREKLKEELREEVLNELDYTIPVSARYVKVEDKYSIEKDMLEYEVRVQTLENIAVVDMLSESQAKQIIKDEEEKEEVERNKEKRPLNDIRNKFEDEDTEKDKKEETS